MTDTIIEGTAIEVIEPRAVAVVQQPGQALVNEADDPAGMVTVATRLADVLADIVAKRGLFATIQGKRYPTVEAWMTIARLDNVVAREPQPPIEHDDGSYEAFAELVRLSDGMVIGSSSALCGTPDDKPWSGRPKPARRSMAQTRATSRAFRQQYSWIMALTGYEPTPAEEMPSDSPAPAPSGRTPSAPAGAPPSASGGTSIVEVEGTVKKGDGNGMDMAVRETPQGPGFGFKLTDVEGHPKGRKSCGVRVFGGRAAGVALVLAEGQRVIVSGQLVPEVIEKKDAPDIRYEVIVADGVILNGQPIPALDLADEKPSDLDALPW